ncbi:MAG: CarD family transcriptional regulator [Deltaproteobacteria bacterium]|nr:MAG: CarD family transcriptional regulator [Deltaproteobacteria bacterium]HEX15519.1 CarD family transcriptional regulator [Deltaproteobacteria bacterium]
MFERGRFVVYPGHGVGVIEDIQEMNVNGEVEQVYVLRTLSTKMTLMVPVKSAEAVGMREVIDPSRVDEVLELLSKEEPVNNSSHQPWNQRYRHYMERINSGSIFEVAKVLKELHLLKSSKGLSFGEKKLMEAAQRLLVQELAVAKKAEEREIRAELQARLP